MYKRQGSLTLGPEAVAAQPTADDLNSTFNFELPLSWLAGDVTLTATIDSVNTVPEADELCAIAERVDPNAFITIEDARAVRRGYIHMSGQER